MRTNGGRRGSRFGLVILATVAMALAGVLLSALGCGSSGQGGAAFWQETDSGYPAPDFTLFDLEGNKVAISDYRGNVVLVHFWATWCPTCRDSMPAIQEFYKEHKAEGVEVIGIAPFESEGKARKFVQEGGYGWTFAVDPNGGGDEELRGVHPAHHVSR